MTKAALQDACKQHKLYRTPNLNDKLYCNFKGFTNIANLEEYTALRALFLEGNALSTLEGLPPLKELRCLWVCLHMQLSTHVGTPACTPRPIKSCCLCLHTCRYAQQNSICFIAGLEGLENLDTLNLSNNHISKLENLSCCPNLKTFICTHNKLDSLESVAHLAECTGLQTLDLQNNELDDPAILDVIKAIQGLKCLYLKGNPMVSKIRNYRKTLISSLPDLTYLDDRPVFPDERRIVTAWWVHVCVVCVCVWCWGGGTSV